MGDKAIAVCLSIFYLILFKKILGVDVQCQFQRGTLHVRHARNLRRDPPGKSGPPRHPRGSHAVSDGAPAAVLRAPVTSVTGSLYSLMPSCRLSHPFPQRPSPLAAIGLLSVSVN